jgi:hypothetical protein
MSEISESNSMSDNSNKKVKSELYHIWKKARVMYDMIKENSNLEGWVKNNITKAYELVDEAIRYSEYEEMFPAKKEEKIESDKDKNNFLSNQDKRYPVPVSQESGDQFVTRCILDANMKKRYPVQGDRFAACMSIFNDKKEEGSSNPGEKFEDPMEVKDPELPDPIKPLLP